MRPASQTLGALVDEMATAHPVAEAVVFRGERLSFSGVRDRAERPCPPNPARARLWAR